MMAKCKFCGETVRSGVVHHAACWETAASRAAEKFCDHYCRFPRECGDDDELQELHCGGCAMIRLLNLGV